jgi:hypothetical protein
VTIRRESLPEWTKLTKVRQLKTGMMQELLTGRIPLGMSSKLSKSLIVSNLAEQVCQQITRKVISSLQALTNGLLSGDDSGLTNAWEEICAP